MRFRSRSSSPTTPSVRSPVFSLSRTPVVACLAVMSGVALAQSAQGDDAPLPSGGREEVQVRMVQVDVSVIDPKGSSFRSVPGLTADQFEIRLDGEPLTEEQRAELTLDRICDETAAEMPAEATRGLPLGVRPIIAMVDFNYLDARGRDRVADAIEALADEPGERGETYKIYGLTQQLRMMSDGFTRDPDQLRAVARQVRRTAWRERPIDDGQSGAPRPGDVAQEQEAEARRASGGGPALRDLEALLDGTQTFGQLGDSLALQVEANTEISTVFESVSDYDAIGSVTALEAVMRAHTFIPGRKIVVLFTTEAFRIADETKLRQNTGGIRELSRQGFAIWTVEVEGIGAQSSKDSELLSALAQDTGGSTVRNTGRLEQAFSGAREQIGCYYLFSLPVPADPERTDRLTLSVRLDTDAYPDLWGMRVVAPTQITVPNRAQELESNRIAALLSPDDFDDPPVDVLLDYPVTMRGRQVLPVRLRVPLAELTWTRSKPKGPVAARLLIDAIAERNTARGRRPFCRIASDKIGTLELQLAAPPPPSAKNGLAVELPCALDERGLLTARGTITDLGRDAAGAGRSSVFVGEVPEQLDSWRVIEPRVEAASGEDFWWHPGADKAVRDRGRRAWRPVATQGGEDVADAGPGDRIALSYVMCGPDRSELDDGLNHALVRLRDDGNPELFQAFGSSALELGGDGKADKRQKGKEKDNEKGSPSEGTGPFCEAARLTVPEYTLMPGRYAFVIHRPEASMDAVTGALDDGGDEAEMSGIVARLPFRID